MRGEAELIVRDLLNAYHNKGIRAVQLPDAKPGETFLGHPVREGNPGIVITQTKEVTA